MLCQFYPAQFHLIDKPIKDWLDATGQAPLAGRTEGARYIHAARLLRVALREAKNYPAQNLAELDAIIWRKAHPEAPN
jgi:hypothetical protein